MYPTTFSNCWRLTIAPMSFASSSGSPTFIFASFPASVSRNGSKTLSWTKRRERGVCRRLQHDGVSGAERGRHLPRRDQDRHVPGDDRRDDAVRLASRIREHLLSERNGLALQLAAEAAEVAEDVSDELRLRTRLRADGVPGLHRERARKGLDRRLDVVRDPEAQAAAV